MPQSPLLSELTNIVNDQQIPICILFSVFRYSIVILLSLLPSLVRINTRGIVMKLVIRQPPYMTAIRGDTAIVVCYLISIRQIPKYDIYRI